jgi:hypothetical protein
MWPNSRYGIDDIDIVRELLLKYNKLTRNNTMQEEFEDVKGVIRIRISKRNRQRNGQ